MKKLLCLLLALVMVLSLAACSDSDSDSKSRRSKKDKDEDDEKIVAEKDEDEEDEDKDDVVVDEKDDEKDDKKSEDLSEKIIGTWAVKINITEDMIGMEGMSIEGLPVTFTFNGDGEVALGFADDAAAILEEQMLDMMVEMMYAELEAQGVGREDADAAFEQMYGASIVDYIKTAMVEMDITSMFAGVEETFDYELDGNLLNIDGNEMTIEIKGDKLTVTECEDEFWGDVGLELPVVMERVG